MYALAINALICILLSFLVVYLFSINLKISSIEQDKYTYAADLKGHITDTIERSRGFNMLRSYTIKAGVAPAPNLSGASTSGLGLHATKNTQIVTLSSETFDVVEYLVLDAQHEGTRGFLEDYDRGLVRLIIVAGSAFVALPPETSSDDSRIPIAAYNIGNLNNSTQLTLAQNALVTNGSNKKLADILNLSGDSMGVVNLAVFW